MTQMILVPIDMDGESQFTEQIDIAARLAKEMEARLVFLTVQPAIPEYVRAQLPPDILDTTRHSTASKLDAIIRHHGLSVPFEIVTRYGRPGQEILDYARSQKADLIVIASRDPRGITHLFGSVAAHVVRHAHCSVYVLRHASEGS